MNFDDKIVRIRALIKCGKTEEAMLRLDAITEAHPEVKERYSSIYRLCKQARRSRITCTNVSGEAKLQARKGKKCSNKLNIGFISLWFERGQAYVTKTIRDALSEEYNTFVFARNGGTPENPSLKTKGEWEVSNLTTFNQYLIPHNIIAKWIDDNNIGMIIFNEEYDWNLIIFCKQKGVKIITYLDYYKEDWKPYMKLYDMVLCSTKRTFDLVKDFCNAHYIGWGTDTELFMPKKEKAQYTFFHNAGWVGINYRKMTPAVILAFDAISKYNPHFSLLIHSQIGLEKLPLEIVGIVQKNERITYCVGTIPLPGLYHKGLIYVYPSKLDGLGLSLIEALACGLPAITTNAPPMNEFVKNKHNGLLVEVANKVVREDNIAFPEEIVNLNDLAIKMNFLANNPRLVEKMSKNARKLVCEKFDFNTLKRNLLRVMKEELNDYAPLVQVCDNKLRLHIGCGKVYKKGYVNIDLYKNSFADVIMDACSLGFQGNSAELVESYHMIEHVLIPEAKQMLKEWFRVLQPGGKLIIECPNGDKCIEDYMNAPTDHNMTMIFGGQRSRADCHLAGYNFERLSRFLKESGFENIVEEIPRDYHTDVALKEGKSLDHFLRVVAVKPLPEK
ncbi:MAG: glycosyltransferase [bacterium]